MAQMRIFVSHSHEDDTFCGGIVAALRDAGADVWYDEHNLGSGQLVDTIERELTARPVMVAILSPSALTSPWVRDECKWAYTLLRRDPSRIILPVTAGLLQEDAVWMFLSDFKRIEAPGLRPFPLQEACGRLLHALALTAPGTAPLVRTPLPAESVDDLLAQGKALVAQDKYREAIPLFVRATTLDPRVLDAWANLGFACSELGQLEESLVAYDRALTLDDQRAWVWGNKSAVLHDLKRYDEALNANDRALALDPHAAEVWYNRGTVLMDLRRYPEAVTAYERALELGPSAASAWRSKGAALNELQRYDEALQAYDQALALDAAHADAWSGRATSLRGLGRVPEAEQAERHLHGALPLPGHHPASRVAAWLRARTPWHIAYAGGKRRAVLLWGGIAAGIGLVALVGMSMASFAGLLHLNPWSRPTSVPQGFSGYANSHFSIAYPSDWTHISATPTLATGTPTQIEEFVGPDAQEVIVGTAVAVPDDELGPLLDAAADLITQQAALQAVGSGLHRIYDGQQWNENDYTFIGGGDSAGIAATQIQIRALAVDVRVTTYFVVAFGPQESFSTANAMYIEPMLASFRFQGG
jgi:Flp pilus assembly protein TadD